MSDFLGKLRLNLYMLIEKIIRYHPLENWFSWVDELSSQDYVVIDQFLPPELCTLLESFFLSHLPSFTEAGVGASGNNALRSEVRGDKTFWLDRNRDAELASFWALLEETLYIFNRYCFLSLPGYEFHLAQYPPGTQYKTHLDQLNNRNNRMISMVLYLNKNWKKGDGGELELFPDTGSSLIVEPVEARCVMFKSAEVPHRVILSHKSRNSLTGWLLH